MLERYWIHEPWGAWRDNMHAALICTEILRPHLKKGSKLPLETFMLRHPDELREEREAKRNTATRNLFTALKAIATKRPYKND